jgi:putative DNA primase/helicase
MQLSAECERAEALRDAALAYAARGWPVFPCYSLDAAGRCSCGRADCSSLAKHPQTKHGFKEATCDEALIRQWWRRWPEANIGIATGEAGLVVIDVDVKNVDGLAAWLTIVERGGPELQETTVAKTPSGGLHVYYRANESAIGCSTGRLAPGIDVRAIGGYVIAPPSRGVRGVSYEWCDEHEVEHLAELPAALAACLYGGDRPRCEGNPALFDGGEILAGARNDRLFRNACAMRGRGHTKGEILAAMRQTNKRCRPPLEAQEIEDVVESAMRYESRASQRQDHRGCNDDGNAARLIDAFGDRIRYCDELSAWFIYDGRRWQRDSVRGIEDLAAQAMRRIGAEATAIAAEGERRELLRWALRSGDVARFRAAMAKAASDERVRIRAADLDRDPWLLTCLNGTLDLHSGELRPHDPAELISRLAPVEYDATARSPLLEQVLEQATGGDEEFGAYLQRAAGYSLTGLTGEEAFFLLHGPEATGKTTLTEALMAAMGDYAKPGNTELFLARAHGGGPREELVSLDGSRLIVVAEFARNREMNEALLKQLTGGDTVSARGVYEHERSFGFIGKLWFHTNHVPAMSDDDGAVWRRARILPFSHVVPVERRERAVKETLRDPQQSGAAILAWAVAGCTKWQQEGGLGKATAVEAATRTVRESMNPLLEFFRECCSFGPCVWTSNHDLKTAYLSWIGDERLRIADREWGARLQSYGAESRKRNGARGWLGIGLR